MLNTAAKHVVNREVRSYFHRCRIWLEFTAGLREDVNALRILALASAMHELMSHVGPAAVW